jgi:2-polyprenyl-3-methyl-5-hydroxy-6-metoxy-1,4-benzoquinol methylase
MSTQRTSPAISDKWHGYYQKEAELKRFVPEQDPFEAHRCAFALQLRLSMAKAPGDGEFQSLARRMADHCDSVADIGCGDGHLASLYRDAGIPRVAGTDISQPRVERCMETYPGIDFRVADIYSLPFESNEFDTVSCIEVIEHTEHPRDALRELGRIASGNVVVTVPYDRPITEYLCPCCGETFYLDGHIQRFDEASMRSACEEAGLRVVALRSYTVGLQTVGLPIKSRAQIALRELMRGLGLAAPRLPKYLGALCEPPG